MVERLLVGAGAPIVAALLLWGAGRRLPPDRARYAAFAIATGVSLLVTAIDVLIGSPLTTLSLVGPSPGLGVRFFGIGNELEATIGCLLALGSGAAVTALAPADPRRAVAITAGVAALVGGRRLRAGALRRRCRRRDHLPRRRGRGRARGARLRPQAPRPRDLRRRSSRWRP